MRFCTGIIYALALLQGNLSQAQQTQWLWQEDRLPLNPSGIDLNDATSWAWGDLNEDGFTDILVRKVNSNNTKLVAFRGVNPEEPPYWLEDPDLLHGLSEPAGSRGVSIADLDGDSRLNIITLAPVTRWSNQAHILYWNRDQQGNWLPDSSVFPNIAIAAPGAYPTVPFFFDVGNDGDLDMLVGAKAAFGAVGARFFENTGSRTTPVWREDSTSLELVYANPPGYDAWSPILMQINGDSLPDLVTAFDIEGTVGIGYYPGIADSSGRLWSGDYKSVFNNFFRGGAMNFLSRDVDGNGIKDFIVLQPAGTARVYLRTDSTSAIDPNDFFTLGSLALQEQAASIPMDYNNDGKLDLLAIGLEVLFIGNLTVFQACERATLAGRDLWKNSAWFRPPANFSVTADYKAQLADINRNGQPDFVFSRDHGYPGTAFEAFENSGPDLRQPWSPRNDLIAPFAKNWSRKDTVYFDPGLADLDGDGDVDLLLVRESFAGPDSGRAAYRFFENDLVDQAPTWRERPGWLSGLGQDVFFQSAFSDLDTDGDLDLIFGKRDGTLILYQNTGTSASPAWQSVAGAFAGINAGSAPNLSFADFDSDGLPDLILGNYEGKLFLYRNESILSVSRASDIPSTFRLSPNYPNPFNPQTTISYELATPGPVRLRIYNLLGRRVRTLVDAWQPAGRFQASWDGKDATGKMLASGVYFFEIRQGNFRARRKMLLLR